MAFVSAREWKRYISRLSELNTKAADEMRRYVQRVGFSDVEELIRYAFAVATKYGEASATLSALMYDATAALEKAFVSPAVPAATASFDTVARTVRGIVNTSENVEMVSSAVGRLVKQAGADTTLQNALRDGAQFAWIPAGDTCAFCITLASRGWQPASKKAIKNGHAEHIHSNCDCTYAIRFDSSTQVRGYHPEQYRAMYDGAEGSTPTEKINSMRRRFYQENKEEINEQKRDAYAKRQELNSSAAEETKV